MIQVDEKRKLQIYTLDKPSKEKKHLFNTENGCMEAIYVCSPYRPQSKDPVIAKEELASNVDRARRACRILAKVGYFPLAPHLYMPQFLQDSDERERADGLELAMEWLELSSQLWVWGTHISEGMAAEIARASELGIPIRYMPEPTELVTAIVSAFKQESDSQVNNTESATNGTEMEEHNEEL